MNNARLFASLLLLFLIIATGSVGYWYFEDMQPFESFYMTLITISTVGFGEVKPLSMAGRILTITIIVSGISLLTYTLGQIASIFIEGEIRKILGRRKLERTISRLKDHFIICGYGRIGNTIANELTQHRTPMVVIEQDESMIEELEAAGILYLQMDATVEESLLKAGLMQAKGLVTAVSSDANNVFIALTARGLNPDIFILARSSEPANENKLLRAGANRVVSPYVIGGRRMAEILERPTVVDFIDQTTMDNKLGFAWRRPSSAPAHRLPDSHWLIPTCARTTTSSSSQ